MAHSTEILKHLKDIITSDADRVSYSFLVPNLKGLETALSVNSDSAGRDSRNLAESPQASQHKSDSDPAGNDTSGVATDVTQFFTPSTSNPLHEISVFTAATETFSRKNTNCSIDESLQRFRPVITLAKSRNIRVRAYISVVLGCPYEGPNVSPQRVADLSNQLIDMGADEISLGDTTGMGTAPKTHELLHTLERSGTDQGKLAVHFHDTYGQALVNSAVALEHGIRIFDSSVAGLGGCPYAKGATGNVATEDLVYFLHGMGMDTGVDLEKVAEIGRWISAELNRENGSRVGKAILNKR
ncbi:MAG: hypothetical protein M1816_003412 [Peltula sp. TS41687]|nr:MAG: hypothetical protein M1816_003412 [Peltula sp. TS41687]